MRSTKPLCELAEINPKVILDKGSSYSFVEMEAVEPGMRYVSAKTTRTYSGGGAKFCPGDTLFARITPCLENGKIAQFKTTDSRPAFGSTEFFVFRHKPGISDSAYIFYLVNSDIVRKPAEKSMSGASGRQRADLASIKDLDVPAPPLATQRRIAAVLSVYDDLIENNQRRIAILEELARNLYREWFVEFRFPGHEGVEIVERDGVRAPEGWGGVSATDALFVNPSTKVPRDGLKPFLPMGSLSENSMLISEVEYREGNSGAKFKNGDTLFARITPCLENGKTGFVQFLPSDDAVAFGSTEFIVLRSRTLCPEMVYLLARSDEFRDNALKSMSGATGRQRVQEACFDRFFLAQPDVQTLALFKAQARPLFRAVQTLALKNANLRQTRDLLLPKLVSGELDVSELEIAGVVEV